MELLFVFALVIIFAYNVVASWIAEIRARQLSEAYKKIREIAKKKPGDG